MERLERQNAKVQVIDMILPKPTMTILVIAIPTSHAFGIEREDTVNELGYRKPRTVATAEELAALPDGVIIKDSVDEPWAKREGDWYDSWGIVRDSGSLLKAYGAATVLWEPKILRDYTIRKAA